MTTINHYDIGPLHWNGNVISTKFPSVNAPEAPEMTTPAAANDENFEETTYPFQCAYIVRCFKYSHIVR